MNRKERKILLDQLAKEEEQIRFNVIIEGAPPEKHVW